MSTTHVHATTKFARIDAAAEFSTAVWRWRSETDGSSRCGFCGDWIPAVRLYVGGEHESWLSALAGSMLDHLEAAHVVAA